MGKAVKISKEQIELIQREADKGNARAQGTLGWMYLKGKGLARDHGKAFEWYKKAAEQGEVMAQNCLRIMYQKGIGVARDFGKAAEWAMKAADSGHVQAQVTLATFYEKGMGVAKDPFMAHVWLTIANEYGYRNWLQSIMHTVVKKGLTKRELQDAQRFVMNWQEKRRRKLAD
jgi:TPR repeat protein